MAGPSAPAIDGSVGMSFEESGVAVSEVKVGEPEVVDVIKELSSGGDGRLFRGTLASGSVGGTVGCG